MVVWVPLFIGKFCPGFILSAGDDFICAILWNTFTLILSSWFLFKSKKNCYRLLPKRPTEGKLPQTRASVNQIWFVSIFCGIYFRFSPFHQSVWGGVGRDSLEQVNASPPPPNPEIWWIFIWFLCHAGDESPPSEQFCFSCKLRPLWNWVLMVEEIEKHKT